MNILVFTDNKAVAKKFSSVKGGKEFTLAVQTGKELKKAIKETSAGTFLYIDLGSFPAAEQGKILKSLEKPDRFAYGIIDPTARIKDIAGLFHNGASDYIGKELLKGAINVKRIKSALCYREIEGSSDEKKIDLSHYILSGKNWKDIKTGHEYTFCFMFIELDNKAEIKTTFGGDKINEVLNVFQTHVQRALAPYDGRIWMWQDWGGLILFPFDGESCDAIEASVRLMLNRNIISSDIFDVDILVSYRIALHLGNTVYHKRGDTGKIISDAINSIYHLGQKYAQPGNLYLTNDLSVYIPTGLEKIFLADGQYENRQILRMRRPIYKD